MNDIILELFTLYGLPALAVVLAIGQYGVPLPTSILLMTAGALQAQGDLEFWQVLAWGLTGAMLGDHAGYLTGRLAGPHVASWTNGSKSTAERLEKAEAFMRKRGTGGIFFTRWLVSPLGPFVNLASGIARHPAWKFTAADFAGEFIWVAGYVSLGAVFADQIAVIADLLANAGWMIGALAVTGFLGWRLYKAAAKPARAGSAAEG